MVFLFSSILFTSCIYLIFRGFAQWKVDALPAIVINYFVSSTCSLLYALFSPGTDLSEPRSMEQLGIAAALGIMFMVVFHLLSLTTHKLGVAASTIISRMSMVIPAAYSIIILGDEFTLLRGLGIGIALVAIYFSVSRKKKQAGAAAEDKNAIIIPLLAFLGVGFNDTLIKISQVKHMGTEADPVFITLLFALAFFSGLLYILLSGRAASLLRRQNLKWGALLGLCNFSSLTLFYMALSTPRLDGSQAFPINSVGIVAVSTLAAILFMNEKLNARKWIGLALAVVAILLISFG